MVQQDREAAEEEAPNQAEEEADAAVSEATGYAISAENPTTSTLIYPRSKLYHNSSSCIPMHK